MCVQVPMPLHNTACPFLNPEDGIELGIKQVTERIMKYFSLAGSSLASSMELATDLRGYVSGSVFLIIM